MSSMCGLLSVTGAWRADGRAVSLTPSQLSIGWRAKYTRKTAVSTHMKAPTSRALPWAVLMAT